MKTIKKVLVKPVLVEFIPEDLEEGVLYISRKYSTVVHSCLCGCKKEVVTPLNKEGWVLSEKNGKVTLSPSIGNYNFPCKSHYIITKNVANFV